MKYDIENNYIYHKPSTAQTIVYQDLRTQAKDLAESFIEASPVESSRELSLALTKLEEAVFWANANIARNTP